MAIAEEVIAPRSIGADFGRIDIRVVVLPRKTKQKAAAEGEEIVDLAADETLVEEGSSPVGSYLERQKGGKLCCVFLVNGQRHDGLDNSFIVQELGFKYLRKRMMIIVDVDGLRPEALGELMQGSRQSFYKGRVWEAIFSRLTATLKGDPDLQKLEEEAEAEVAQLQAGEQKVKETLDSLIEFHHRYADHVAAGAGLEIGVQEAESVLGAARAVAEPFVSLERIDVGQPSDYPVLVGQPDATSMTLRPGIERTFKVRSLPPDAWKASASVVHELDSRVPELHIAEEHADDSMTLRLLFEPPDNFDNDDYPVRATLRVFARFNGFKDPRQLAVALMMAPARPAPEPKLLAEPSFLRVTSREPVRIWLGNADTHVRLRWNGSDDLTLAPTAMWRFEARCLTPGQEGISITFSQPRKGRFSLLIGMPSDTEVGTELRFEILAIGPAGRRLAAAFDAVTAERPQRPQPQPRLLNGQVPTGAARRPPYELKYIHKAEWDISSNFGGDDWTADDAAAFQEPTDKTPLTLIINQDLAALDAFRKFLLAKKLTEAEVQVRLQKYTSHVYFHLYQMYEASKSVASRGDDDAPQQLRPEDQKAEIRRVALTLVKLMQVSR